MRVSAIAVLAGLLMSAMAVTANAYELSVTVTLDGSNEPVANAVVSVDSARPGTPVSAEIYQKDRAFHPHVLVVPVGSSVDFPNRDNTQHHVYSFSPAKTFNIELYADRPAAPIVFDKPGIVELGCNIHDHMQGFVVVTDTASVGQTDASGQVTLSIAPQGTESSQDKVTIEIWHPRLPDNTRPVTREIERGSEPAIVALNLEPEPSAEGSLDRLQQRFREL
ncbi:MULTISPECIES: methylamine utilization protein [Marinobacter]|jgi:plastocyanin|uniref:methylamine utilization protein n=1 Tax=Marinobacter TaxID=2742 RepID=UPI0019277CE7|nr:MULTISPECIES: methylamine utilization protein [Marinobacter]MBL3823637.1 methylamine utilization protein [Marinobacter sp. MC3]MBL3891793.1 methylamine utilization protein [Marinobacter sp. MW3]MCD1646407.1 methylamine utilization protein [Marinobacter adhaerens]